MNIERRELKIFLTFVLVFTLFMHWGADNSYSRYDLTQALVEDSSADIEPYAFNTIDKRKPYTSLENFLNETELEGENLSGKQEIVHKSIVESYNVSGGEVYSDKAPLSPVLAVPGYLLGDAIGGFLKQRDDRWRDKPLSTRDDPVYLSLETVMEQFLITFTVTVLFGAFLMVLIYRMVRRRLDERVALYTTGIAGLGTVLFYYSTTFYGVIAASTLAFASYYMVEEYLENGERRSLIIAGFLGGLSAATEYYVALVPFALAVYLFYREERESLKIFLPSVFVGLIPVFIYNFVTTGNPLWPVFFTGHCNFYAFCFGDVSVLSYMVSHMVPLNTGIRLLLSPAKGILLLSPVLLLALPGAYKIYRKDRKFLIIAPGIFILFFLFNSFWPTWMAGRSFGPRYLVPGIPFLMLAVAYGIKTVLEGEKWKHVLVLVLFAVSFLHMIAAFQILPYKNITPETYEERYTSMEPIWPDFYEDRIEGFLEDGPRSELMMSFLDREKGLDIAYRSPRGPRHVTLDIGGTFLKVDVAFLPLLLLIIILGVFWARDRRMVVALVALALIIIGGSLSTTDHEYGDGFTSKYQNPDRPWMGSNGSISFHAQNSGTMPALTIHPDPNLNNEGKVRLSLNGEEIGEFYIWETQTLYLVDSPIREGLNTLTVDSLWGCRSRPNASAPFPVDSAYDECLSYQITNLTFVQQDDFRERIQSSGFYSNYRNPDRPWMGRRATINISEVREPDTSTDRMMKLDVFPHPQIYNRTMRVYWGEEEFFEVGVSRNRTLYIPLGKKTDKVVLEGQHTCNSSMASQSSLHSKRDGECLSYSIGNISIFPVSDLPQKVFYWDWFSPSPDEDFRWMGKYGKMLVRNEEGGKTFSFYARPYPGLVPAKIEAFVGNNKGTMRRNITFDNVGWSKIQLSGLAPGLNYVNLLSRSGCAVPAKMEERSNDTRCLSFRVKNMTIS